MSIIIYIMYIYFSSFIKYIKTDSIILSRSLSLITLTHPFLISLPISNTITTLGFTIHNALDYSVNISNTVRTANYFLYNIGKARSKLTFNLTKSLLHSLVFSRLRYCNSLFIKIPQKLMTKFDSILRRAVRILFNLNHSDLIISIHSMTLNGDSRVVEVSRFMQVSTSLHYSIYIYGSSVIPI